MSSRSLGSGAEVVVEEQVDLQLKSAVAAVEGAVRRLMSVVAAEAPGHWTEEGEAGRERSSGVVVEAQAVQTRLLEVVARVGCWTGATGAVRRQMQPLAAGEGVMRWPEVQHVLGFLLAEEARHCGWEGGEVLCCD